MSIADWFYSVLIILGVAFGIWFTFAAEAMDLRDMEDDEEDLDN